MGLEPTDLLHAMQALYQLSYAPVVDARYQRALLLRTLRMSNTRS